MKEPIPALDLCHFQSHFTSFFWFCLCGWISIFSSILLFKEFKTICWCIEYCSSNCWKLQINRLVLISWANQTGINCPLNRTTVNVSSLWFYCPCLSPDARPQTMMYSATMPPWVKKTARKYLSDDHKVISLIGRQEEQTATTIEVS